MISKSDRAEKMLRLTKNVMPQEIFKSVNIWPSRMEVKVWPFSQVLQFLKKLLIFIKNDMYKCDSAEITVYGCSNPVEKEISELVNVWPLRIEVKYIGFFRFFRFFSNNLPKVGNMSIVRFSVF